MSSFIALKKPFKRSAGHAWIADLGLVDNAGDDCDQPLRSKLVLFEDKKPLWGQHAMHDAICQIGNGRYSHWQNYLLFSTSDNTDPNANRRDYKVCEIVTKFPSIFLCALPKSGSLYLARNIAANLSIRRFTPGHEVFLLEDTLHIDKFDEFIQGGCISHSHIPAIPFNCEFVDQCLDRMVLHIRDPRQALLSYFNYMEPRMNHENSDAPAVADSAYGIIWKFQKKIYAKENWFYLSTNQKITVLIDSLYVDLLKWLTGWLKAIAEFKRTKVLITDHHELVRDDKALFYKVLKFYDVPSEHFAYKAIEKSAENNFRLGSINEWRGVFDAKQQKKVTDMIPQEWRERFGWD
jgi:hypothetical protein